MKNVADGNNDQGSILVVDDDNMLRMLVSSVLTDAGYNVLTATNGAEALELFAQHNIDCVVTDVTMPRMNGFELTAAIRIMPGGERVRREHPPAERCRQRERGEQSDGCRTPRRPQRHVAPCEGLVGAADGAVPRRVERVVRDADRHLACEDGEGQQYRAPQLEADGDAQREREIRDDQRRAGMGRSPQGPDGAHAPMLSRSGSVSPPGARPR